MTTKLLPKEQINQLEGMEYDFDTSIKNGGLTGGLKATGLSVLQINITRKCNQVCTHCHVDAGPDQTEEMPDAVIDKIIELVHSGRFNTLDITGGAAELHHRFEDLIEAGSKAGMKVIHRCNLTAIRGSKYKHLPEKFAELGIEIVASLPYFKKGQTDLQRGDGVFEKSIKSLQQLNELGYGKDERLQLNLVTNPTGAYLPGTQGDLENLWKGRLKDAFGIEFNNLFTITNMPISRFLEFLVSSGQADAYMQKLVEAFNPQAAEGVMCLDMISVGWDGTVYDCDFNQMLELPVEPEAVRNILDFDADTLLGREIVTGNHCYGCTAGAGSSCGGATA